MSDELEDTGLSDERIEELHEMGRADAENTGGSLFALTPDRSDLTEEEHEIYDCAFRNAFARENGY